MRPWAVAMATAGLVLGCGGGLFSAPETRSTGDDALRRENLELRREKTVAEVELARLRQEVARLEAELATLRDRLARPTAREADRETMAETFEAETFEVPAVEEEELDDEELRAPPPPSAPPPSAPPPSVPPPSAPSQDVDAAARTLYDESYALFHERSYAEAEAGFARFLELYPGTDLADNAQYWIGECRFARGELESALEAFMRTVELYPEGNKVPDALLKAGRSLEGLGDRQAARATYEEIVRRFGASAAAAAARERLADRP